MLTSWLEIVRQWTDSNSGYLTLLLFLLTLALGWVSGVFKNLRSRPSLLLELLPGPTFGCTFGTGQTYNGHKTHRTAFCLYLAITNRGSAPTDIHEVKLGYHNHTPKFTFFWCWLEHETVALTDFQVSIGEHIKVYPFLAQINQMSPATPDMYLQQGKMVRGVSYFEQDEAWGGWLPRVTNGRTRVKVRLTDAYGRRHSKVFQIPFVTLEEARKYNPFFGATLDALRSARVMPEPADA